MQKISVIVPAYNAEKTIDKCINSILKQTYDCIEVIVINDGSTDSTLKLLNEISNQDNRVKIITIDNKGVSHARNVGLKNATGELITFVDSDDYIDKDMYRELVSALNKYDADISICSYKNVENDCILSFVGKNDDEKIILTSDESIDFMISGRLFSNGVWNKIYKKELFNDIKFDESIKFNEDLLINFYLFRKINRSIYIDRAFYNYVAVSSSVTHSSNSLLASREFKLVADIIEKESKNCVYHKAALDRKSYMALGLYRAFLFSNSNLYKNEKKELLREIIGYKKAGVYNRRNDKLSVFLFKYFPHMYKIIFSCFDKVRIKKLDPD